MIHLLFDADQRINLPRFSEQHREAHGVSDRQGPQMDLQEQNTEHDAGEADLHQARQVLSHPTRSAGLVLIPILLQPRYSTAIGTEFSYS